MINLSDSGYARARTAVQNWCEKQSKRKGFTFLSVTIARTTTFLLSDTKFNSDDITANACHYAISVSPRYVWPESWPERELLGLAFPVDSQTTPGEYERKLDKLYADLEQKIASKS